MKKIKLKIKLFLSKLRLREFKFCKRLYKGGENEQLFNSVYDDQLKKIERIKKELNKI